MPVNNPGGGGGGTPTYVALLVDDSRDEPDPISDYPLGFSQMEAAEDVANEGEGWMFAAEIAMITTRRGVGVGRQDIIFASGWEGFRFWGGADWDSWRYYAESPVAVNQMGELGLDHSTEATAPNNYTSGLYWMSVSAGADWGPNTGEAGTVQMHVKGSEGTQTFTQYSDGLSFSRGYTGGSWSSWQAL